MAKNQYPKRVNAPKRIELDPEEFELLIDDHGIPVKITPSILCPRRTGEESEVGDANHDLNCPLCSGSLTIDIASKAVTTIAFIQGVKLDKVFDQASTLDPKDAFISTKANIRLHYWYKVEILDCPAQFNETIKKKTGNIELLRYPFIDSTDYDGQNILVDEEGTLYTRGTHFNVSGQTLTWITANRPAVGKLYSFLYSTLPTFRILELLHETRQYLVGFKKPTREAIHLPQYAHMRWDWLARGQGSDFKR